MVHTICKAKKEGIVKYRGKPVDDFYKDGKPQIYCYGYIDLMNDEPLEVCQQCADWVEGEQCYKDWQEVLKKEIGDK